MGLSILYLLCMYTWLTSWGKTGHSLTVATDSIKRIDDWREVAISCTMYCLSLPLYHCDMWWAFSVQSFVPIFFNAKTKCPLLSVLLLLRSPSILCAFSGQWFLQLHGLKFFVISARFHACQDLIDVAAYICNVKRCVILGPLDPFAIMICPLDICQHVKELVIKPALFGW